MPRKVPTSAEPIMPPSTAGGWPTEPIVLTTPSTAATMPNAGRPPARRCDRRDRRVRLVVVGLDLAVHQALDLVRVQVARDHHAQVVGDELDHVVVAADRRVLLEQRRLVRAPRRPSRSTSGLPCAPSAGCRRAAPSAPCSAPWCTCVPLKQRRAARRASAFSTLGWLLATKAPSAPPHDRHHLDRQRVQDHADVAAVRRCSTPKMQPSATT